MGQSPHLSVNLEGDQPHHQSHDENTESDRDDSDAAEDLIYCIHCFIDGYVNIIEDCTRLAESGNSPICGGGY